MEIFGNYSRKTQRLGKCVLKKPEKIQQNSSRIDSGKKKILWKFISEEHDETSDIYSQETRRNLLDTYYPEVYSEETGGNSIMIKFIRNLRELILKKHKDINRKSLETFSEEARRNFSGFLLVTL